MTINLGGVPIQDVRVAGVQAQRVMLGTGSTAVEVWSASVYPLTGTWGPLTIQDFGWATRASHTITEPGQFTITHVGTMPWASSVNVVTPAGTVTGTPSTGNGGTSTATTTVTLSVGAVVQFQTDGGWGSSASGTWSITKISPPVVTITGTSGYQSRDQFRAACTQYGADYQTVEVLPFLLDTSQATRLAYMFDGCSSLTAVPNLDTSQATNLIYMFRGCSSLTAVPDLDTSQATELGNMFRNCSSLTAVPDLDTSNATSLTYMFYNCSSLTAVPDLDTSNATSLTYMFNGCSSLTDGNVRCIGRHPSARTAGMITGSGLTREPFYDTNGNPI